MEDLKKIEVEVLQDEDPVPVIHEAKEIEKELVIWLKDYLSKIILLM